MFLPGRITGSRPLPSFNKYKGLGSTIVTAPISSKAATDPLSLAFDAARRAAGGGRSAGRRRDRAGRPRPQRCPQSPTGASRSHRPCGNPGDPRRLRRHRRRAPHRLRPLRHPGAMPDVCGRHLVRAHSPGLFRGPTTRRAAGWSTGHGSSTSPPATTRRTSMAACARRRRPISCADFFRDRREG